MDTQKVHLVLAYKNFAAMAGISHIGLGVAALNIAKILMRHGIKATVLPILNSAGLDTYLTANPDVTHVEIAAPWIPVRELQAITFKHSSIQFAVNCHSNVGFLQADTNGVALMRQYIDLELGSLNFNVAGNSGKFIRWLRGAYQAPCTYLPNMYYLDYTVNPNKPVYGGGILRIGAFGATRPQKNLMSAAGAALELHEELKVDTEFWVSGGRLEGGGQTILNSVKAMVQGISGFTLKEFGWQTWPQFRDTVRKMHLLIQGSYTESFNMVSADGVAEGVPSVVSDALDWLPDYWKANSDDVPEMARVGRQLLFDPQAPYDGMVYLEHDENITISRMREVLGDEVAYTLESMSRAIYTLGEKISRDHGIIIADTKFEFGRESDGRIILIDEVMTPDSSRFWAVDAYRPGQPQPSFDKQPLRDYLDGERRAGRWNGEAPAPPLPASVVDATSKRYLEAYRRITGAELNI